MPGESPQPMTGAQSLVKSLERMGVEVIFGIPGGSILPAYDPLFDSKIRHILVRHEQGAGHAAEGYAQATGRVGVCIATSGPGATNLVTAIADAYMDSVPMVAITGQVASKAIGTDAFQEADIRGITFPITKHSFLITDPAEIPHAIAAAFHLAKTGRPGPVLVDIAKDALAGPTEYVWPEELDLPGYRPVSKPHGKQIREAARLIGQAKRPVIYLGGGVNRARAWEALAEFVEITKMPVVTTLMARGAFPDSHPLNYGMPGMHGTVAAVGAMQRSDLLIALGARFDDRVTGKLDTFAPEAKIIHADIDPAEISKNRMADVPIVGDLGEVLAELNAALREEAHGDIGDWVRFLDGLRKRYLPTEYPAMEDGLLSPEYVIKRLGELVGPEATYVAGVGQHQMWAAHLLPHERPARFFNSGGAGTMGYCVPAAMGAKVGRPDDVVWGIDGDGCFQMTNQELVTCFLEGIPIKIAVMNNRSLGMVRQWQTLFYGERYSNTNLKSHLVPDFPKLAEAMGAVGLRAETVEEVDEVIAKAMEINDRPVVVEFVVHKDAMVWPMVPAGTSNDQIKIARDLAPDWSGEEDL
ncbi:MAG: acetolactate synthase large subunit [Actinobacteria bacterium]|nr:acetolactate synthase large subunit [Propionicimonas sp.]MBU3977192.1 acetolactate synthase large subunit [Actinomycetota bacterium]MBA3021118.1 acetolactate synthase large subunit [Propionicimonas sp.]MBU3985702.1 acetolactate synthase large subunit [Actinomycetota bacterium]MBU4008487.1 acetolactate synthase large subunit [Actinomycetota bacterium]MBU4066363.1 acetolactate synthase large subunit [Actinomycetota bacterium]